MRAIDTWGPVLHSGHPAAVTVLVRMAITALDSDGSPWFSAPWQMLATACGRPPVTCDPNCRGCKACAAARKAVQREIRHLVDARAITRVHVAAKNRSAKYRLHLDGPAPVDNLVQEALIPPDP